MARDGGAKGGEAKPLPGSGHAQTNPGFFYPCGVKFSQWVEAHRESCGVRGAEALRRREAPAATHVIAEASKTLNFLNVHNLELKTLHRLPSPPLLSWVTIPGRRAPLGLPICTHPHLLHLPIPYPNTLTHPTPTPFTCTTPTPLLFLLFYH